MKRLQAGFTLIELIIVISILGLLAVVAIPRYVDLQSQAALAQAKGVFGAAQSAATINFVAARAGTRPPAGGPIMTGEKLLMAMDGIPDGWRADKMDVFAKLNGRLFKITVAKGETRAAKAVLAKNW